MKFPLTIVDEYGNPMMMVNDEEQLYDYMDEIDVDGETYEVPHTSQDDKVVVFGNMWAAWDYNPVGFSQTHLNTLLQWPELLETCPDCGAAGEPSGKAKKRLVCPDCGKKYDPIDIDGLLEGKIRRK